MASQPVVCLTECWLLSELIILPFSCGGGIFLCGRYFMFVLGFFVCLLLRCLFLFEAFNSQTTTFLSESLFVLMLVGVDRNS